MKKTLLFIAAVVLCITNSYSQASYTTGNMKVEVGTYSKIVLSTPDGKEQLRRAMILVETTPTNVFDHENDATVVTPTALVTSPLSSDFEITGVYDNGGGVLPNVSVSVNVYGWTNRDYAIAKYTIKNIDAASVNATIGYEIFPRLNAAYGLETVSYNADAKVIRFFRDLPQMNLGIKLLSASLSSLYSFEWYSGYQKDADFATWMNKGTIQSPYVATTTEGTIAITAQAPIAIAPGQSVKVFYALALGADEQTMLNNISAADLKYKALTTSLSENKLAGDRLNLGNYPNPFISSTKINYQLPAEGVVSLKIYNAYGKEVATLVNEKQSGGSHSISYKGQDLSSGVYYYTLRYNDQVKSTKKLIVK